MKKYTHALTKDLTPDNWKDKLNLDALSLDDLVDIAGDLNSMEKFAKKVAGYLKEVIKTRMPDDEYDSPSIHYVAVRTDRSRKNTLDEGKIAEEMGEEWVEDHRKPDIEYTELRLTRKAED